MVFPMLSKSLKFVGLTMKLVAEDGRLKHRRLVVVVSCDGRIVQLFKTHMEANNLYWGLWGLFIWKHRFSRFFNSFPGCREFPHQHAFKIILHYMNKVCLRRSYAREIYCRADKKVLLIMVVLVINTCEPWDKDIINGRNMDVFILLYSF